MAKTSKKTKTLAKNRRAAVTAGRFRSAKAGHAANERRGKLERVKMPPPLAQKAMRADAALSDDSNEGKYVYCIIKSEQPLRFGQLGIGTDPADVHTVGYRDIAAVVSNTPMVV